MLCRVCTPRPSKSSKCVNKWDDIDDESHFDLGLSCSRSFRKTMVLSAGFPSWDGRPAVLVGHVHPPGLRIPRIPRLVWWCLWIPPHPEVWWSLPKKLDTFKVGKGLRKSLVCKLGNLVDVVEFAWLQYLNPEAAPQTFYEQWVKQIKTV